jgi:hypothetical protein
MGAVPAATDVACPLLVTVATDVFSEVQVTCPVIFCVDPSFFMPMAMNCWMAPTGMAGIGVMEDRVAEVTVRVVFPEILPEVAVMVAVPAEMAVAMPLALTVATDVFDEAQVTCGLTSWLVPSENAPRAINCWATPTGVLGLAGIKVMEDRVAEVTVSVVLPEILPEVAVMVAVPAKTDVARPLLLTVATDVFDEVQVTCMLTSWLVPSEYLPVAINCWVVPAGMLGVAGVTIMEDRVAEVTVRVVLPEIFPEVAVMVALPAETQVARPLLLIVATDVFDEVQVTCGRTSWLVPSENAPRAANCWVAPTGVTGDRDMEANGDDDVSPPPPHVVRDTAKDPRNNIVKTSRILFMKTPPKQHIPPHLAPMVNAA